MALYGILKSGFLIKRYPEIRDDIKQKMIEQFDVPVVTTDNSILGRIINAFASSLADVWQALEGIYLNTDINLATGAALDRLALGGRRKAKNATIKLRVSGTNNYTLRVGEPFTQAGQSVIWKSLDTKVIKNGIAIIEAEASSPNANQVDASSLFNSNLSNINLSTALSISSSTKPIAAETDDELRKRLLKASNSGEYLSSLYNSLLRIEGVSDVIIRSSGACGLQICVFGNGNYQSIASAIHDNTVFGTATQGDISISLDNCIDVKFYSGCYVDVQVNASIVQYGDCCADETKESILNDLESYINNCNRECVSVDDLKNAIHTIKGGKIERIEMKSSLYPDLNCKAESTEIICVGNCQKLKFNRESSGIVIA